MTGSTLLRNGLRALWFLVAPVALASLAVVALRNPALAEGGLRWLHAVAVDQPLPAGIVLFVVGEALLWSLRHSLPGSDHLELGGRADVPPELRLQFEGAQQLLEESGRILREKHKQVERRIPAPARAELGDALDDLRAAVTAAAFDAAAFQSRHERAAALVERHLTPWQKSELRSYVESISVALGVAVLLRVFAVEAFKIPSGSMLPTLQITDHVFVNKGAYGLRVPGVTEALVGARAPARGDIIVFKYPEDPSQDFIKRAMALPGDVLEVQGGHPIINGWRVPSCVVGPYEYFEGESSLPSRGELHVEYIGDQAFLTVYDDDSWESGRHEGPFHVAPGEVWVLGDNRFRSSHSTKWNGGRGRGVPLENIKGRAMIVWLSFEHDNSVATDRLFHNVMGHPILPRGASPAVLAGIERCLGHRPPVTQPPPPG